MFKDRNKSYDMKSKLTIQKRYSCYSSVYLRFIALIYEFTNDIMHVIIHKFFMVTFNNLSQL